MERTQRPLIMHVLHRFDTGGLENGVVNLINRLPSERWRHVVVALTEVDPVFARRLHRADVRCLALHKPPGQGIWMAPQLWRLFRELRPAIVHTRNLAALETQLPPSVGYPHPDLDGLDNIIRIVGDWLDPKRVTEAVAV